MKTPTEEKKSLLKTVSKYLRKELLIVVATLLAIRYLASAEYLNPERLQTFLAHFGIIAPLAFISICTVAIPAFVPPLLFIGIGSVAFGKTIGAFYSLLGITIAAGLEFLLGRYSISKFAEATKKGRLKNIDQWVAKCNEILCVLSLQLIFFTHPMVNYALSVTKVATRNYLFGTFLGIIPRTFLMSHLFFLFISIHSFHDIIVNPHLLFLPMVRGAGVLLLVVLTKGASRDAL